MQTSAGEKGYNFVHSDKFCEKAACCPWGILLFISLQISPSDDCFLLISTIKFELWHQEDLSKPVVEHWMKVHVFGNVPSPAVTIYGLWRAIEDGAQKHGADTVKFGKRHFYVDDGLLSLPYEAEVIDLLQRTQASLAESNLRLHKSAYTSDCLTRTSSSFPTRGLCSSQQWICYSGRSLRTHSPTQQWLILNPLLDKSSLLSTVFLNQLHKCSLVLFQTQRPCKAAPVWLWDQLYRSMQGARVFTFSATMTKVDSAMQKPSGWGPSSPSRKASHSQLLADGHGDCSIPSCGWFLEKGRGEDKWPRQCENLPKASCRSCQRIDRQAWLQLMVASCRPGGEYAAPEAFFYLFIYFYKFLLIIVSCLFSL